MQKPDPEVIRAFAYTAQNVPLVKKFIVDWEASELKRLPDTLNHTEVAQGRCQVLGEIVDLFDRAPDLAQP